MTTRKYSSRSQQTTLSAALTSSAGTTTVVSGSTLAGGVTISAGETFTVVIDPDTALEEIVDITAISGNTLTITRAIDGSSGVAHSAGAVVRHMAMGRDYREANTHIEATTGHGATGAVVGTTNTQTLTNKTLTSPTITGTGAIAGTFTGNLTGNVTGNVSGTSGSTTGNAATVTNGVYTTDTGTVTSTMIANGTIVNADINASAAIDKTKISGTAVTVADTGTVTSTMIADDTIVNADVNSAAAIAYSKLNLTGAVVNTDITNDTITNAKINTAAAIDKTKISGTAITAADTGTVTSTMILDGTIANADINASAAIDWTKLGISSTVSSTEISYVDGVTSAIQTQIDSKLATATAASTYAPLASPALTGVPTAPTAAANTNTTQVATTAYVQTEIADLIAAAPGALDTLDELAAALGDDAAFSTTVTNSIAAKLPLVGGTMSGAIAMGTSKITGLGTPTVSTDAATKAYVDTMLPLAGGTMTGAIAMSTNKITGVGDPTNAQDVATKNYIDTSVLAPSNLTGPITSVGAATSIASQTGTGTKFVMDTSPTLVTPTLGVATATSINATTIPSTKTLVVTTDKLSALAATTSAELAGVISDETGTGALVFGTSPTLTTPVLGVATATSINGTTIPTSKTLVATDSTTYVVPSQTGNTGKFLTTDGTTSSWGSPTGAVSTSGGDTITVASGTTVPLTIQNNGTGNSFVVNDVASDTTPFIVDQSGNVGVGVASPTNKLSVGGGIDFTTSGFSGSGTGLWLQATNTLGIVTAGTNRVVVDADGDVGIGNNTPTYKLDVIGSVLGTTATSESPLLKLNASATGNNVFEKTTLYRHTAGSDWTGTSIKKQVVVDATPMGYIEYNPAGLSQGIGIGTNSTIRLGITQSGGVEIGGKDIELMTIMGAF